MTTTFLLAPADRFNAYINFDFGRNSSPTGVTSTWKGIAGAAKFRFNDRFALTPRLQWFDDTNGFSTGTAQSVKEFTFTARDWGFLGEPRVNVLRLNMALDERYPVRK